ncbi:hypothetical protein PoB_004821700 [Plakobranchus ocellatus]|uniref:Uncharacterized protein n=1 Tax=Plakobranchus ocellatus TaxID=259542 RepID=A0AAV4BQR6_9GAST|nr:hypothetical protein PoB_004821700 [Plakobranchus ocellatus]
MPPKLCCCLATPPHKSGKGKGDWLGGSSETGGKYHMTDGGCGRRNGIKGGEGGKDWGGGARGGVGEEKDREEKKEVEEKEEAGGGREGVFFFGRRRMQ